MRLSFETFCNRMCRMRRLTDFIGRHLDDDLRLEDLAAVADLSPAHLVRMYQPRTGEAPMQTVRRLRLKRAYEHIQSGRFRSITDVGFDAGYGSSAAFAHAFQRHFGMAPTEVPENAPETVRKPALHLEFMPEQKVWQIPYSGKYLDNGHFKARLSWRYLTAGGRGWRGWRLDDRDHPFAEADDQHVNLTHFLPVLDDRISVREADLTRLPGGLYAVLELPPAERERCLLTLPERIHEELGCQLVEGRFIERDLHIRDYRAPQERRIALYVPVAPLRQAIQPKVFDPVPPKRKF